MKKMALQDLPLSEKNLRARADRPKARKETHRKGTFRARPLFLASLLILTGSFAGCNIGGGSGSGGTKTLTTTGHLALARYDAPEGACTGDFITERPAVSNGQLAGPNPETDPVNPDNLWAIGPIRRLLDTDLPGQQGKIMASRGTSGANSDLVSETFSTHPHLAALVKQQMGVRFGTSQGDSFFENNKASLGGLDLRQEAASTDFKLGNVILILAESLGILHETEGGECNEGRGCIWKGPNDVAYQIINQRFRADNALTEEEIQEDGREREIVDETDRNKIDELLNAMGYTNVTVYTKENGDSVGYTAQQALQIAAATAMGLVRTPHDASGTIDLNAKPDVQTIIATLSSISIPDCSVHKEINGAAFVELGQNPSGIEGAQPSIYNAFTVGYQTVNPFANSTSLPVDDATETTDDSTETTDETPET